jgi:hypothetical protein
VDEHRSDGVRVTLVLHDALVGTDVEYCRINDPYVTEIVSVTTHDQSQSGCLTILCGSSKN